MTVADVLDKAADLIEQHGWWCGRVGVDGYCVMSAITTIEGIGGTTSAAERLRSHVGATVLSDWNDKQPDGKAVVSAMRACADKVRVTQAHTKVMREFERIIFEE